MAITTNNVGFTEADLLTKNRARLGAKLSGASIRDEHFDVGWHKDTTPYEWDEDGCREAAEFFIKLADELKRRKDAR